MAVQDEGQLTGKPMNRLEFRGTGGTVVAEKQL